MSDVLLVELIDLVRLALIGAGVSAVCILISLGALVARSFRQ